MGNLSYVNSLSKTIEESDPRLNLIVLLLPLNKIIMNYKEILPEKFEYRGKWIDNWFSNYVPCKIEIDGIVYNSTENYYQAMKSEDPEDWKRIAVMTPAESKKAGRRISIRPDWEEVKYHVMRHALRIKFSIPEWRDKLLATGNEHLVEWNNWGDRIWGVASPDWTGKNLLGKALMEIREEIKPS